MQIDFWKKHIPEESGTVYAPMDGTVLPLAEMPDPVFAEGTLGDGVCLLPSKGRILSPVSGVVSSVAESRHAFCITADDGMELMLHVGVDTVSLGGRCFRLHTEVGKHVKKGELLCTADLDGIRASGLSTHTAIVLVNGDSFETKRFFEGAVIAGRSPVFLYREITAQRIKDAEGAV